MARKCKTCDGAGTLVQFILNPSTGLYSTKYRSCYACGGEGIE